MAYDLERARQTMALYDALPLELRCVLGQWPFDVADVARAYDRMGLERTLEVLVERMPRRIVPLVADMIRLHRAHERPRDNGSMIPTTPS